MKPILIIFAAQLAFAQSWVVQQSGTSASLRGISAVNDAIVWASGSHGTYLRTTDGGATWRAATVPGAEALDFRDVHALDQKTAWLLSSGPGDASRIYKTTDSGEHWILQFINPDATGFLDALAFWDGSNGIVLGDPVGGLFAILTTRNGGKTWSRRRTAAALPNEGAFAASGTCLIVHGQAEAWFGTGGPGAARVFHSQNRGQTWSVASTPLRNDAASAGVFSLAVSGSRQGVIAGGDYRKPAEDKANVATTSNGGRTWLEPPGPHPKGFRSAVAFMTDRRAWIVTGASWSDVSLDDGKSWKPFDTGDYNAIGGVSSKATWAVGPKGRVARLSWP